MLIPTNIIQETIQIRRHIHQYPELGAEVHQTVKLVAQELQALGLEVHANIGKNGLYADLNVPNANKRIALRADMDALPIQELGNKEFQSTIDGVSHMCGHDAHTAMLLGAAKWIVKNKAQLKHNIRFIFQPDEENVPGGAIPMIEDGVLNGVDEIYGQHVWPTIETGKIGICEGPAMGQPDILEIQIKGKGGHAAYPHITIDPIIIAAQYINAVQTIVSRNTPALEAAVISFTIIEAGTAHNIIPETVKLTASIRTLSMATKTKVKQRLYKLLEHTCQAHGAAFTFNYINGHTITYNDPIVAQKIAQLLPKDNTLFPYPPSMAGEDFGYYSQQIPACFIFLGCRNEEKGITAMLHNPYFDIDENCLEIGLQLWYTIAMQ
ncbi:M20 metallopeptidase family protein [Aureispira anguillae]|uniref:Amidohydrolase n=1 Tax=Aureispira anguillae TaxID=2864201 RepID=A0A916DTP3_9BACT|nr:amidohydrolase [Aureispira anguillae]BDS11636.1 amidohydrolase [Aureispira anguillae]